MGRPKALLPADGRTFVRRILDALRDAGVAETVVVVREGQPETIEEIERAGAGRAVVNPRADDGQLSSLIVGLDAVDTPGVTSILVTLVDVPLIQSVTVRTLIARAAESRVPIVRAVYRGRHGHPVIFKRELFDALRAADPAVGAKAVMRAESIEDVDVDDPGVVRDVDTPDDYRRAFPDRSEPV
jgi:molybdenum cofactor cytidylyltransferase